MNKTIAQTILSALLLLLPLSIYAEEIVIRSKAMKRELKAEIILPAQYDKKSAKRYPVIYLLHGAGDTYKSWISNKPSLDSLATLYKTIIVCPDAGGKSWYLNAPHYPSNQIETYIGKEVVSYIDKHYHTLRNRKSRAITGLSMGGHGAAYLALRHKNTFGAFGTMSGGLDYADKELTNYHNGWNLPPLLGTWNYNAWYPYTAIAQLDRKIKDREYRIIIHCGTEDFFLNVNRKFHKKLQSKGITHQYTESEGSHNWTYWNATIEEHIRFFNQYFNEHQ